MNFSILSEFQCFFYIRVLVDFPFFFEPNSNERMFISQWIDVCKSEWNMCLCVIEWLGYTLRKRYHKCNMCVLFVFFSCSLMFFRCEFFFCLFTKEMNEESLKKKKRWWKRDTMFRAENVGGISPKKKTNPVNIVFWNFFFINFFVCLFDSNFHIHFILCTSNKSKYNKLYVYS